MTRLTVLTWNLRWMSRGPVAVAAKRDLLAGLVWDVALLQEVGPRAYACMAEAFPGGAFAHEIHDSGDRYPHAVAILPRNGVTLCDVGLIPLGPPPAGGWVQPERALAASAAVGEAIITVASWHAPHAAGRSVRERQLRYDQKMRAYRDVAAWAGAVRGSLVLGGDMNTWVDDPIPVTPNPDQAWYDEHRFHGAAPPHGLVDVLRRHLDDHPVERDAALRARPDGPLAVTYDRGHGGRSIPCRMDRIFVSPAFRVDEVEHLPLAMAWSVGSDHAIVRAELSLPAERVRAGI